MFFFLYIKEVKISFIFLCILYNCYAFECFMMVVYIFFSWRFQLCNWVCNECATDYIISYSSRNQFYLIFKARHTCGVILIFDFEILTANALCTAVIMLTWVVLIWCWSVGICIQILCFMSKQIQNSLSFI